MTATTVPITRAPTAAATVSLMVIQNAARMLYSASNSRGPSINPSPPQGLRRARSARYEQGSGFGGLVLVSTLKPDWPTLSSTAFCHEPSETIFSKAALTLSHIAVSPFFSPTPYFSVENGLPTTLSLPLYCGCAAKPARMTLSVVTASTLPPLRASTHLL